MIPRLPPGAKVAEVVFAISSDIDELGEVIRSTFPAMFAAEPPPVLPPYTEELLLSLARMFRPAVTGTILATGDPLDPDAPAAGDDAKSAFTFNTVDTVLGLSTVDGRDVLVARIGADMEFAQPGESGDTVAAKGFSVIDLATGAMLSSLVRLDADFGAPHPDTRGFMKITSRILTDADRPSGSR